MTKFGLDFGTTNSSISLSTEGKVALLDIDQIAPDPKVCRSLLYFFHRPLVERKDKYGNKSSNYEGDFRYTFGSDALANYLQDNRNRHPGIVRQIFTGRMIQTNVSLNAPNADLVAEYYEDYDYGVGRLMQALKTALKSPIYKGTNIFGKFFTLEQMIGIFVSKLKNAAENQIGEKADYLKVGRPVHFLTDPQKDKDVEERLRGALNMVGFKQIEFEYEPVAAAKYFLWKYPTQGKRVLVFDFGGGTLDTAIVEMSDKFRVLATDGVYIGGNLLNSDIMRVKLNKYLGTEVKWGRFMTELPKNFSESLNSWYGIANLNNPRDMKFLTEIQRESSDPEGIARLIYLIKMNLGFEVYEAIETAKKTLSNNDHTAITFRDGPIDINVSLSREEFETIIKPRISEVEETVMRTLKAAKVVPFDIDVVVRTGGSSLIPAVEQMLERIFGKEKVQLFDAFTSIAAGLSLPE